MPTIQALNRKKSPRQQPYRLTIDAGRPDGSGTRQDWVVYSTSVPTAIGLAVRSFRRGPGKKQRYTDWTVTLEPMRGDETVVEA